MKDQAGIRAELITRPKFSLYEDTASNKFDDVLRVCIVNTEIKLFEKYKNKAGLYEKSNAPTGITLPAGVAYGTNSKLYKLNSGTTPVIPTDIYQIKSLSVLGDAGLRTDSSSTYDTDTVEGSGIPGDNTVIALTDVYHELIDEDGDIELQIVIGTTAQGTTPKLMLKYIPTFVPTAADNTVVVCPRGLFNSEFMPELNAQLKKYIGNDGF